MGSIQESSSSLWLPDWPEFDYSNRARWNVHHPQCCNIIPPYGATNGGEGATVEYAVRALGSKILSFAVTHCGAMKGLLQMGKLAEDMPLGTNGSSMLKLLARRCWRTTSILKVKTFCMPLLRKTSSPRSRTCGLTQLFELNHKDQIHLHAWMYHIEMGEILEYDHVQIRAAQTQLSRSHWLTSEQQERICKGSAALQNGKISDNSRDCFKLYESIENDSNAKLNLSVWFFHRTNGVTWPTQWQHLQPLLPWKPSVVGSNRSGCFVVDMERQSYWK